MARPKRILTSSLYVYCEPGLARFAKRKGLESFGSFSAYISFLIAKDAGDKASMKRIMEMVEAKREPSVVNTNRKKAALTKQNQAA